MGTVYVFFADGFEEVEAFTSVDVMRRAGLNVEMITVTPDEIVTGAHDVPVQLLWRSARNFGNWSWILLKRINRLLPFVPLL